MTTTAHERALQITQDKYVIEIGEYPNKRAVETTCKTYLHALLDDAETVEAIKLELWNLMVDTLRELPGHKENKYHEEMVNYVRSFTVAQAADGCIATLKRMGGV